MVRVNGSTVRGVRTVSGEPCGACRSHPVRVLLRGAPVGGPAGRGRVRASLPPDQALLTGDGALELLGFLPGAAPGSVTITAAGGQRTQPVGPGLFTVKIKLEPGRECSDPFGPHSDGLPRRRDGLARPRRIRPPRHPRGRKRLRRVPRLRRGSRDPG